ncbi:MAG: DNA repair protein RecN, partial [Thermodesulfovibrionales bacterium]|nr:DNA repair protein RecN [Thermodesulfovibrionales bacterium]
VNIQTLINIGSKLITIHGQHESQNLLKKEAHLNLLDGYAGLHNECKELKALYEKYKNLKIELETLIKTMRERSQREEFLNYQIREIDDANLKIGELEDLKEQHSLLSNINKLRELSEEAYYNLYGVDGSVVERLKKAYNSILSITEVDKSTIEVAELLHSAIATVDDAVSLIRSKKDTYESNPEKLDEISDRLDLIKRLFKKYGNTIEDVINYRDNIQKELSTLITSTEKQREIEEELSKLNEDLNKKANDISSKRLEASMRLQSEINEELKYLGFKSAFININIDKKEEVSPTGFDDVEFLFTANPGEPARPLIKVASGGELSRIMLAIRTVSFKSPEENGGETVIFDEVDSGIGGNTALQVARRLKEISTCYQTICITHLPQIASMADNHLMIEKTSSHDLTEVFVKELDENSRKYEIARMLSGSITDTALRHAEELISANKLETR